MDFLEDYDVNQKSSLAIPALFIFVLGTLFSCSGAVGLLGGLLSFVIFSVLAFFVLAYGQKLDRERLIRFKQLIKGRTFLYKVDLNLLTKDGLDASLYRFSLSKLFKISEQDVEIPETFQNDNYFLNGLRLLDSTDLMDMARLLLLIVKSLPITSKAFLNQLYHHLFWDVAPSDLKTKFMIIISDRDDYNIPIDYNRIKQPISAFRLSKTPTPKTSPSNKEKVSTISAKSSTKNTILAAMHTIQSKPSNPTPNKEDVKKMPTRDLSDQSMYRMIKEGRIDALVLYGLKLMENEADYNVGLNLVFYAFMEHRNLLAKEALEKLDLLDRFVESSSTSTIKTELVEDDLPTLGVTQDDEGYIHFSKDSFALAQYTFEKSEFGYVLTGINTKEKLKVLRLPDFIDGVPVVELHHTFFDKVSIKHLYTSRLLNTINITSYVSSNKSGKIEVLHITDKIQYMELDESFNEGIHDIRAIAIDGVIPDFNDVLIGDLASDYFDISFNKPYKSSIKDTIIQADEAIKALQSGGLSS